MEQLGKTKIDFKKLDSILKTKAEERAIKRVATRYSPDDLKRVLMKVGQARCTGKKFVIDKDNKFVYENIFKWAIGDESMLAVNPYTGETEQGSLTKGIYIAGPTGTGKTMCLNVFRDFLQIIGAVVDVPNYGTAALSWRTFFATELAQNCMECGDVRWVQEYPVLCIQDVGSENKEAVYMGNRFDTIGQILQMRGETQYLTMITSNDKISEEKYGARVASRLCSMCNYFELKGKDRRKD